MHGQVLYLDVPETATHAVDGDWVFPITATAATDQQWRRAHAASPKYFPKMKKYFREKSILPRISTTTGPL